MILEYDELYKKWVVWLKKKNSYEELYRGTKKDCMSFIRKEKGKHGKGTKHLRANANKGTFAKTNC